MPFPVASCTTPTHIHDGIINLPFKSTWFHKAIRPIDYILCVCVTQLDFKVVDGDNV